MLIKYRDRITVDGTLALDSYLSSGSREAFDLFLNTVRGQDRGPEMLPFRNLKFENVVFEILREDQVTKLSIEEASLMLKSQNGLRLYTDISEYRLNDFDKYLKSEAHHNLAFSHSPLILGYSDAGYIFVVYDGQSGRTYKRTEAEILEFLQSGTFLSSLLSDLAMMSHFRHSFENIEELESFIAASPDANLDFVIRAISMASGSYFEISEAGDLLRDKILELNPNAEATLNFRLYPKDKVDPVVLPNYETCLNRLKDSLTQICEYAKLNSIENDAIYFKQGLKILDEAEKLEPTQLWLESGRISNHYRLFSAAINSDNFAGMGSWNDAQIKQDETFHRLSNQLVLAITEAVCASIQIA